MANALVQFREDELTKNKASMICDNLGIDLPTYLRMCITRLIKENGIPFSMKISKNSEDDDFIKEASIEAAQNGVADMTLEEINAEIALARKENKKVG